MKKCICPKCSKPFGPSWIEATFFGQEVRKYTPEEWYIWRAYFRKEIEEGKIKIKVI